MSVTCQTPVAEVHYEPDCAPDELQQVLAALDRWSKRTGKHVTRARTSVRHDYRASVAVEATEAVTCDPSMRCVFHIPTRNVSRAGLGIVAPPRFVPSMVCDTTPLVRTDMIFRLGAKIKLTLGPQSTKTPTVTAEIIRVRPIHRGFFDIGVRFLSRES